MGEANTHKNNMSFRVKPLFFKQRKSAGQKKLIKLL